MTDHGPLTPSEVSFLAESESVTIIPTQSLPAIPLVCGQTPALRPPHRADVPLWYALLLRKHKNCRIVAPAWLSSTNIRKALDEEIANPGEFTKALPFRWLETAEILLGEAGEDIQDPAGEDVRVLLRELREVRQAKAREGLKSLDGTYLQMDGLGLMEITEIRGFAKGVEENLRKLSKTREFSDDAASRMDEDEDYDNDTTVAGESSTGSGYRGSSTAYTRGSSSMRDIGSMEEDY